MSKLSAGNILKPAASLLIICVVITFALAVTNNITSKKIEELQTQVEKQAMSRIIQADSYTECEVTLDGETYIYYTAGDPIKGYILTLSSAGYGGDVSVMTGINLDGTIASIEVLNASSETPGLGQNATKSGFSEQFFGKSGQLSVAKNATKDTEIDAITGATITSTSVTDSVNFALKLFEEIRKGM
ncbi:MAG: RnfABCDGE type electron transport complex subunit G [Oscillospiraceae bacterium]|nr:RnfABCDGE type electron transport complex subunit G [Oscillospiraceae bacterium]